MSEDAHRVGSLEEEMERRWGGELHDILDDPHDIRDPPYQRWLAGSEWRGNARALAEVKQTMQDEMQRMTEEFRQVAFQIRQTTQWYVEERHAEAVLPTLAEHEASESSVYHDVEEHAHRDAEEPFPEIWPPLSLEETMGPTPERERTHESLNRSPISSNTGSDRQAMTGRMMYGYPARSRQSPASDRFSHGQKPCANARSA